MGLAMNDSGTKKRRTRGAAAAETASGNHAPADPELAASTLADAVTAKVMSQLAPLMGEQMADLADHVDRWFVALRSAMGTTAPNAAKHRPASQSIDLQRRLREVLISEVIHQAALSESWQGWVSYGDTELCAGGNMQVTGGAEWSGIVSPLIELSGPGLYRVTIKAAAAGFGHGGLRLRITDPYGQQMGPDTALDAVSTSAELYLPRWMTHLKLHLLGWRLPAGASLAIDSVRAEKLDSESYFRSQAGVLGEPCIASLAAIPSRRAMLSDAVESLLVQCDRVRVFLNGYVSIPDFLNHPRIEVKRSQDWDDKGDAGKFAWVDDRGESGYRVIADDDLVYPPDFARRMVQSLAKYENRAIAGLHGVLLKYPNASYYNPAFRHVVHFESALGADRTVHVLGTNAVAYHTSLVGMRWSDFAYRNMADIFLARYAQRNRIPMVMVSRPHRWVRQNSQANGFETIFDSSVKRTGSRFDTSIVQNSVVRQMSPMTIQRTHRPKVVLCLVATSPSGLKEAMATWQATRRSDIDWVLAVAAGNTGRDLQKQVSEATSMTELHVLPSVRRTPAESVAEMLFLAGNLDATAVCIALDSVRFQHGAWALEMLARLDPLRPRAIHLMAVKSGGLAYGACSSDGPLPVVSLLDSRMLQPEILASAMMDSPESVLRSAFAGTGRISDALEPSADALLRSITQWNSKAAQAGIRKESGAAHAQTSERSGFIPPEPTTAIQRGSINEVFERVMVLNLDRRKDRWDQVGASLARAGITAERFRAIDGQWDEIARDYRSYCDRPLIPHCSRARKVGSNAEFFCDYDSQRSRVAYLEQSTRKKAIASAGAWGYLRTWERVLEQALTHDLGTLLVLDDDVVFHKDCQKLFSDAIAQLPEDWLILQLGTLQYHWEEEWVSSFSSRLYQSPGFTVGSHAVGLRAEAVPLLLDHVQRMELPFDIGALSAATLTFPDRCFVVTPNLAIQRLEESDITTSEFQRGRGRKEIMEIYRWNEDDYEY